MTFYAPIVLRHPIGRAEVRLRAAVSGGAPPQFSFFTEVSDVGEIAAHCLDALLLAHGERPPDAWLVATKPEHAGRVIEGRSCALAMVLASLSEAAGVRPSRPVVATGVLTIDDPCVVAKVEDLDHKIDAVARRTGTLRELPEDVLVLAPTAQVGEGSQHYKTASGRTLEVFGVASVAAAIEATLGLELRFCEIKAVRESIERLRHDNHQMEHLLRECDRLRTLAARLPLGWLARVVVFHAECCAAHALRLRDDPGDVASWQGESAPVATLRERLSQSVRELLEAHRSTLPVELIAQWYHFEAKRSFVSHDFGDGIELTSVGLTLPRRARVPTCEGHKLLRTRGQLRLRQGMRLAAVGLARDAHRLTRLAYDDVIAALGMAESIGAPRANDLDRGRVHVAATEQGLRTLGLGTTALREHAVQTLDSVLAAFGVSRSGPPPEQEPAWGLGVLYRDWLADGRHGSVVDHWRAIWDAPVPARGGTSLRASASKGLREPTLMLPTLLLEAAIAVGDREIAEHAVQAYVPPLDLREVVAWWPALRADPSWKLGQVREALRSWLRESRDHVPPHLQHETWLAQALASLRASTTAQYTAEVKRTRNRLLMWFGRPVPGAL